MRDAARDYQPMTLASIVLRYDWTVLRNFHNVSQSQCEEEVSQCSVWTGHVAGGQGGPDTGDDIRTALGNDSAATIDPEASEAMHDGDSDAQAQGHAASDDGSVVTIDPFAREASAAGASAGTVTFAVTADDHARDAHSALSVTTTTVTTTLMLVTSSATCIGNHTLRRPQLQ